jgi:hypothetical protein
MCGGRLPFLTIKLLGGVIKPTTNKMVENQNFGQAIEALKEGKRVARQGWNGKGMFIFERPADELEVGFIIDKVKSLPQSVKDFFKAKDQQEAPSEQGLTKVKFGNYLCMYAADGSIVNGWLASQTDILSNDWCILD